MIHSRSLFGILAAAVLAFGIAAPSASVAAPRSDPAYHQTWPPGFDVVVSIPAIAPYNREARVSPASIGADQPDPAGATALRLTASGRYALAHRVDRDRWRHRLE